MNITPADIYAQTGGGLDIILHYYPQAEPGIRRKNYKFRIRTPEEDPSPSATIKEYNGRWFVKDFGTGEKQMDAIAVCMKEEGAEFSDALLIICDKFNIVPPDDTKKTKLGPEIRKREAEADEEDGYSWKTKDFTKKELQVVFAANTWSYLSKRRNTATDEFGDELATTNALSVCKKYNFVCLESYTHVKDGMAVVIRSTEHFPIFMFDEGTWQKIYKPLEREAQYRFFSIGKKPEHYVFGLKQCEKRLAELRKEANEGGNLDEESDNAEEKAEKLNEIILCSGGSDGLNVAALGYEVVWFNSETVKPESVPFLKLKSMAEFVYNLPDLDESGIRAARNLGFMYLDLHTIWLPDEMRKYRDFNKGRICKDVRDYLSRYTSEDFRNLIKLALMFRFWDEEPKRDRSGRVQKKFGRIQYEYRPNNRRLYNFLYHQGFGKLSMPNVKSGEVLVHVQYDRKIVTPIQFKHIRRFIESFLESRHATEDLFNSFYKSDQISDSSLENLKSLTIDFKTHGPNFQYLFFANEAWRVTADKIEKLSHEKSDRMVWCDKVIPHKVKLASQPPFTITFDQQKEEFDIQIHNKECLFTRYLIQTSRVYWRKELEELLPEYSSEYQTEYLKKYQFALDGSLLSAKEIAEQKRHFIAKICSLGYLLHRYKDPARNLCVWGMDYAMTVGQSFGGTGKSLCYDSLKQLLRQVYLNGRNEKLTENQFMLSAVNEHTDYIYVDDAYEYFNFRFFYGMITGSMECEGKGLDKWVLSNEISPKICITSNYTPRETDTATRRRMWFTCFSDYFHKNANGEYLQDRSPKDELGKNLFTDFNEEEWNHYLNFIGHCLQSWLAWGKVDPPMNTVLENTYRSKMGQTFHAWADVFFADRLNTHVQRTFAFEHYRKEYDPKCIAQAWFNKLDYWCKYNSYVLNPKELRNAKKGEKNDRIMARIFKTEWKNGQWMVSTDKTENCEIIYIQTPGTPLRTKDETTLPPIDPGGFAPLDPKSPIGF